MTDRSPHASFDGALLSRIPLFAELSREDIDALGSAGQVSRVLAGTLLCKEGDPGDQMYVVMEGEVRIHQDRDGTQNELAKLGAGSHFGEMALIDGRERSADVSALVDCTLFSLSRRAFFEVVADNPQLLGNILLYFSKTIRSNNRRMLEQILEQERRKSAAELQRHQSISQMVPLNL